MGTTGIILGVIGIIVLSLIVIAIWPSAGEAVIETIGEILGNLGDD